jgi:hypothetical protein
VESKQGRYFVAGNKSDIFNLSLVSNKNKISTSALNFDSDVEVYN